MAQQGGSDLIPATYSYATATLNWQPKDADKPYEQGMYLSRCVYSVSFAAIQVTGPSSEYQRQITQYGLVLTTITRSNLGMRKAPAYVDVVYNGVQYKMQVGAAATVPKIVKDLLNATNDYVAS